MAGGETTEADRAFAEHVGYTIARSMSEGGGGVAMRTVVRVDAGLQLLTSIEEQVRFYVGDGAHETPSRMRAALAQDLTEILAAIAESEETGVPTLAGLHNGFDLNPVINILDPYTLEGFDLMERDPGRPFSRGRYSPEKAARDPRIELVDADEARQRLATLLANSARLSASGPSPSTSSLYGFTVYTTKPDYVLDSWRPWGVKRLRFGASKTTPVTGNLASGDYHFEGKNGALTENDGSLSTVGPFHPSTILNW